MLIDSLKTLRLGRWIAQITLAGIVAGCATQQIPPQTPKPVNCSCPAPEEKPAEKPPALPLLEKSSFSQLPGWASTKGQKAALDAFMAQCGVLQRRKASPAGLVEMCRRAPTLNTDEEARNWMEKELDVWQLQQEDGRKEGLLTGYYEPLLNGSRKPTGRFNVPLYGVPSDLITVKLDELVPELKGKRIRGRVEGNTLVPYYDRAEWETNVGPKRGNVLVWVDDKLDAFLLQVQGSGRVKLPDGSVIRLSYADQNGYPYKAIGRVLVEWGELTTAQATIPGIRAWAEKNPAKVDKLLNNNPSVVFFAENTVLSPEQGPIGALGLPLTGEFSLAVDRSLVPYGALMWLDSTNPVNQKPMQHAALAQDTGGAIRGRVRADYFWGTGHAAGEAAGKTRQTLRLWLLWPKGVDLPKTGND
ncbi:MAG TPA: MltA domain-containing protein [Limnobacter sp.]|uniref:murein transglycosylase A n=1 Tax=Limnobacter sp. TaxID=2003368 RepID=UPI002EDB1631